MPLGSAQKSKIALATPQSITAQFSQLQVNWQANQWLRNKNVYANETSKKVKREVKNHKTHHHTHLREYIAASAVTHCADAWSYVGHAINAHLRGDPSTSRHLGYYAELRAAMALLAAEGIGAFDSAHCVVNKKGQCLGFAAEGTHRFVWDALQYWATLSTSQDLVLKIVEPAGLPLDTWLQHFSVGAATRGMVAQAWLEEWGLDLQRMADDREARNLSSYRPTAFHSQGAMSFSDAIAFVRDTWQIFEPTESQRFQIVDRYLLQYSLELFFRSAHAKNRSAQQAKKLFDRHVRAMLHTLSPGEMTQDQWANFLVGNLGKRRPGLFEDAAGKLTPIDRQHHKQVIARALLLLRLASGACHQLLKSIVGAPQSELAFWWKPFGSDRGIWATGAEPTSFIDLWADIRDALKSIDTWHTTAGNASSYKSLWSEQAAAASTLGDGSRPGLWGIGL